ncbi:MAG: endonuclease [Bdellovibrionales bacterium]|nr:endonuclease [Bdellovibrionales bacterium]
MKTNFIKTVILFSMFFSGVVHAAALTEKIPYYGEEFYSELGAGVTDKSLLMRLKVILKVYHNPHKDGLDTLGTSCEESGCYQHTAFGYNNARKFLFGSFYLIPDTGSGYGVKDVYCDHNATPEEFSNGGRPGPGVIPDSTVINAEHTWPQSRFTGRYPTDLQKSDLHHLFPTDSEMNSVRGNNWFGEVVKDTKTLKCKNVRFGKPDGGGQDVFEPPREHRGNVARALFYFSTRYDLPIDPRLEAVLRKWHKDDPVDDEERDRNEKIMKLQGNRNPFIDYPELVDKINDF